MYVTKFHVTITTKCEWHVKTGWCYCYRRRSGKIANGKLCLSLNKCWTDDGDFKVMAFGFHGTQLERKFLLCPNAVQCIDEGSRVKRVLGAMEDISVTWWLICKDLLQLRDIALQGKAVSSRVLLLIVIVDRSNPPRPVLGRKVEPNLLFDDVHKKKRFALFLALGLDLNNYIL